MNFRLRSRFVFFCSTLVISLLFPAAQVFATPLQGSPIMDVNPLLNLIAFALVIERILEIIMFMIPGIEEKKLELEDDPDALAVFKLKLRRYTLAGGIVLGVLGSIIFKFGILDEIFPGSMSPANILNLIVTGLIAGSGSEPVHQMILLILSIRDRLKASQRA